MLQNVPLFVQKGASFSFEHLTSFDSASASMSVLETGFKLCDEKEENIEFLTFFAFPDVTFLITLEAK